ncbi:Aamy domain-containing protein, partial [Haematococcus lacustris]
MKRAVSLPIRPNLKKPATHDRGCAGLLPRGPRIVAMRATEIEPLEVLRQENNLLKSTIVEAEAAITDLEDGLRQAGIEVPEVDDASLLAAAPSGPEDYWSPALEVAPDNEYVDEYGAISPIPNHDGTACFQWDNTLWSSEGHFRVSYKHMGINRGECRGMTGLWYREWAPGAKDYWSPALEVAPDNEYVDEYGTISPIPNHDGTACFQWDNTLWSSEGHFRYRWKVFKDLRAAIDANEGGLAKGQAAGPPAGVLNYLAGYKHMGINRGECRGMTGLWYREWAPGAKALCLIGEFNNWKPEDNHWARKNDFGTWELFLPDKPDGTPAIPH